MNDTAKPTPITNDTAIIDKIEAAAEAAAHRGVNAAVADCYATYGPKIVKAEAITVAGSMFVGVFGALVLFAAVKAIGARLFGGRK